MEKTNPGIQISVNFKDPVLQLHELDLKQCVEVMENIGAPRYTIHDVTQLKAVDANNYLNQTLNLGDEYFVTEDMFGNLAPVKINT